MLHAAQATAALIFLALLVRLRLLLSASPLGVITPEILYLRQERFRPLLGAVLLLLVLESLELVLPALADQAWVATATVDLVTRVANLTQSGLLVFAALWMLRAFGSFSRLALEELEVTARHTVDGIADRLERSRRVPGPAPRRGP